MNTLSRYVFDSIVCTSKFQRQLDTYKIWKQLFLLDHRHLWENQIVNGKVAPAVHVGSARIPSLRKQESESQERIEKQLIQFLSMWRDIDQSHPDSTQIYKEKYHEDYHSTCEAEIVAQKYKTSFDRSQFNMTEIWDKAFQLESRKNEQSNSSNDAEYREFLAERELLNKPLQPNSDQEQQEKLELEKLNRMRQIEQERLQTLTPKLESQMEWYLRIQPSKITNAKNGLFVHGKCPRGTVIGIYPGMAYSTTTVKRLNILNEYLLQCYPGREGGTHVNGEIWKERFFNTMYNHKAQLPAERDSKNKWLPNEEKNEKLLGHLIGNRFMNPFAQLHMVNHPPSSVVPNVVVSPFVVNSTFPKSLLCYIPNKHFIAPFLLLSDYGMLRTIVYIAERDLQDEEVYVDYRLNPLHHPEWYVPIDEEKDMLVWK
jgi:hypothetical protein